jgi:hypothetical protein
LISIKTAFPTSIVSSNCTWAYPWETAARFPGVFHYDIIGALTALADMNHDGKP